MEIYLDNAATTKPYTIKAIEEHISGGWYNPSSAYGPAERIFNDIKETRDTLLNTVGFKGACIFTSGGTEANNMAIMSAVKSGAHFITSAAEHSSVYEAMKHIEHSGFEVDFIKPQGFIINAEQVAEKVKANTALVSVMHVNNETGALNDINAICAAVKAKNRNTLFHSDGVQALFKTKLDIPPLADFYTLSAHKIHALKGTGAIMARDERLVKRLHYGGEQEYLLRPGTENTIGIQAFREALINGRESCEADIQKIRTLEKRLVGYIASIEGAVLNLPAVKVPHIVNAAFMGIRAEVLVRLLGEKGIYIGTGSACSRGKLSRALIECGVERKLAEGAIRISMCADNTEKDIDICAEEIEKAVKQLRRISGRHE